MIFLYRNRKKTKTQKKTKSPYTRGHGRFNAIPYRDLRRLKKCMNDNKIHFKTQQLQFENALLYFTKIQRY